ncbi:DUF1661 domain-containing protein [Porphyromonas gulae]|uniref:DUF1661 domain-containing protein n=1 Tax=Porphyromonas gulae TaxID=111105 RepID=UPI0034E97B3B
MARKFFHSRTTTKKFSSHVFRCDEWRFFGTRNCSQKNIHFATLYVRHRMVSIFLARCFRNSSGYNIFVSDWTPLIKIR